MNFQHVLNENMVDDNKQLFLQTASFRSEVKERSDRLMNYFLLAYFFMGLVLAGFYDTWSIGVGVGTLCLIAYYSTKYFLPESDLYQYVLAGVLGVFMAQFIYQMHGMFEMHFAAFIGSAILITYQNWKLQLPMLAVVTIHHSIFGYLQNTGFDKIYFTQLDAFELRTFIIHILLAAIIIYICGLWAYQMKKYTEKQILQSLEMGKMQKEIALSIQRKQNEDALEKSNKELRKSNTELDRFVYSVSHDLRAPLTSMLGLIEISQDEVEEGFVRKNLQMVKYSISKLDNFISDILNYSRNARQEVVPEQIDFKEVLNDVTENLKYINKHDRTVKMDIHVAADSVFVSDRSRLAIILNNLLSNAIRYQNIETSKPYVMVSVEADEQQATITVKDNGIGVKKEYQNRLFEMFYRVSQRSEGSGLGLYIVKETVDKLKGKIEIESEVGVGTSFNMSIPNLKQELQEEYV